MLDFLFLLFDHFALETNTSALKLPSPDTLRLRVPSLSPFLHFLPRSKLLLWLKTHLYYKAHISPYSYPSQTHTPCPALPLADWKVWAYKDNDDFYKIIKSVMNFACREIMCVIYRVCCLLVLPKPSTELLLISSQYLIRINNSQIYSQNIRCITQFQCDPEKKVVSSNKRINLQETWLKQ